ncbi:tetratricopeptide repeat protein [Hyphomicrobium facile]|uniref:Tetratricopeptide repeat-containing protein n=1 Tax=Hyphomicrobium facile TaxID=51670 RepID=A0A1I7NDK9_9HYPH|nr:hypothetical protein [Hyphomicrobium facile]SFV32764.1 hypothetical protein SAMN04488557_1717 [Hyphomicrobium facile]
MTRRFLVFSIGVALVWLVASKSFVAYLAITAPDKALRVSSSNSTALLNLADQALAPNDAAADITNVEKEGVLGGLSKAASGSSRASDQQVAAWAKTALANEPFNARAYRILGEIAERSGDLRSATKLMSAAARHSLHESKAVYWLMRKAFEQRDFRTATYYADVLLRTQEQANEHIVPLLAKIAEDKDGTSEVKALLRTNPPWRRQFFATLLNSVTHARTPLDLLLSLQDSPNPPTTVELRTYLDFLIDHQFYDLAYSAWLQFLSAGDLQRVGFLFNGSFESMPSGLPFDWVITPGYGVTIDIAERPPLTAFDTVADRSSEQSNERALFIEFGYGRAEFQPVWQLLMLAPGDYKLSGQYQGQLQGRRGLIWRTDCADNSAQLGQSDMLLGVAPAWKSFEFDFKVPNTGCRAQKLQLVLDARSASEQMISGSIWIDDIKIVRRKP